MPVVVVADIHCLTPHLLKTKKDARSKKTLFNAMVKLLNNAIAGGIKTGVMP